MKLIELYKRYEDFKKESDGGVKKPRNPFEALPCDPSSLVVQELAKIKLIFENGKVSTTKTVTNITDSEQKAAVKLAYDVPRSLLLIKPAAKCPEYASLTPLLMWAHKKHNGVKYESWDKTDENIRWALGNFLMPLIDIDSDKLKSALDSIDIKEKRKEHLNGRNTTAYTGKSISLDDGKFRLLGSNPITKMILQTWIAHSSIRYPNAMILDPFNWDELPKPIDEVPEVKKEESDLPW